MTDSNQTSDPFAALGVPQQFNLDDGTLAAARDRTGNIDAYNILADPRSRAECLLKLIGGPTASDYVGLPSGFSGELAQAQRDPARLSALRDERWNNVAHLFVQLLGSDKAPTQIGRARMLRAELNAIDALR